MIDGRHCILDLSGCPAGILDDPERIADAVREAALRSRSRLLQQLTHRFHPQGVTALALLAESHISVHTWPESGDAAADIFTCGRQTTPEAACRYLVQALEARDYRLCVVPRGSLPPASLRHRSPSNGIGSRSGSEPAVVGGDDGRGGRARLS